jgi:DNA-binding NtrC family response regulator
MALYREDLRRWQVQYFTELLADHGGRTVLAAEACGMNRTHFIKMINKLGLRDADSNRGNRGNAAWRALGA